MLAQVTDQLTIVKDVLTSMSQGFADTIPGIITAVVLLFIGWLLAKIISTVIGRVLDKLNLEMVMDKIREVDIFKGMTFSMGTLIAKFVYWGIFLTFFIAAVEVLGIDSISNGIKEILGYVPKLISAVLFFVIGSVLANIIKNFITTAMSSMNLKTGKAIGNFVFYFLLVMVAISALNQAGIGTDIIQDNLKIIVAAFVFSLGLGYALASKGLMSNLLAAYYSKDKVALGQTISFQGTTGRVMKKDNTSVTIESNGKEVIIPLSKFMDDKIEIIG